jgi:hypothetical protein
MRNSKQYQQQKQNIFMQKLKRINRSAAAA